MSAQQALMRAIHARLIADPDLGRLVGKDEIRDHLRARRRLPCLIYGRIESRDHSTATEPGEEHSLTLSVFSDGEGRALAQAIARATRLALHHAALSLEGFHLVLLTCETMTSRPEESAKLFVIDLTFRAVTE